MRRRRNMLVLWEWSPSGKAPEDKRGKRRRRSTAREAVGAALLLGAIISVLSLIPASSDGYYRRDRLGRYMCEVVGLEAGTIGCTAAVIVGWGLIVVTIGIVLKLGRIVLAAIGVRRDD